MLTKLSDNSAYNLKIEDVPDKEVSLREAIKSVSIAHGQGFKACNCNCVTGTCGKGIRCKCFKDGIKCNQMLKLKRNEVSKEFAPDIYIFSNELF